MSGRFTSRELNKHLKNTHNLSRVSSYVSEIVYGASDGIVTTFSVVAGFVGARGSIDGSSIPLIAVLVFGFANLFGDAVSMALGNFLSLRAQKEQYIRNKKIEVNDIDGNINFEMRETIYLLRKKGFTRKQAQSMARLMSENKDYWTEFMMNNELKMNFDENQKIGLTSLATFVSFIFFGLIPLLPYVLLGGGVDQFLISILSTGGALLLLGVLRWRISGGSLARDLVEVLTIGSVAASVAYLVGTLF